MDDVNNILVLSRMTKACRKAVHYGVSLARKYDAHLLLVHVVHNPFGLEGWNIPLVSLEEEYKKDLEITKKELNAIIKKENEAGLPIKELFPTGDPTESVLSIINQEKIDLLILTAHEEGRLEHFLFGRSNEEIIRKMPCSIFLIKKELQSVWYS